MEVWQRTLRVLWLIQFLTTLAINLGLTFVPFFLAEDPVLRVEDPSERTLYTGLILAGPFVSTILFTPLWGWVADRTGPKRQVVRACFGLGITQLLMAVAQSPDQMVVIRILQGMVSGVLAACLGLVSVVTPRAQHGRSITLLQSATPAGQIFGPVVGGVLASTLGFRATYALLGLLIAFVGILAWKLLRQDGFVPTSSPNPFTSLFHASRRALQQPLLRLALGILVVGQFAFTVAHGVFAIHVGRLVTLWVEAGELSAAWWNTNIGFTALSMTVTGLVSVVSSPCWGRLHDRGIPFLTPAGAAILSGSMFLLFACPFWWTVLLARVGMGIGIGAVASLQYAVIARGVPSEERNQLMSVATALNHLGNLIGYLLGGVLATFWSEPGNFALSSAAYLLVVVSSLSLELRVRRARSFVDRGQPSPHRPAEAPSGCLGHRP